MAEFIGKHIELYMWTLDIEYWFYRQQNIPLIHYIGDIILINSGKQQMANMLEPLRRSMKFRG